MVCPLIVGLSGRTLRVEERNFLEAARPLGIIVFARNVGEGDALGALVRDAKAASGAALALVDQEGGRVQRLRPPLAPRYPPAATIGAFYAADEVKGMRAAFLQGRLIGADLTPFGLNVPCLPVADVPVPGAHDAIGDRAFSTEPGVVTRLAQAAAEGVFAAGCLPVVKHMPGHGRALADSHFTLPDVGATREALQSDFAPFRALAHLPLGMSAHVRFRAIDEKHPGTLSPTVVRLIREAIGFDGLLMTDDISMRALSGNVARRASAALAAGCDCVLHCNGAMGEMERIAASLPEMTGEGRRRLDAALAARRPPQDDDIAALRAEFGTLLSATS